MSISVGLSASLAVPFTAAAVAAEPTPTQQIRASSPTDAKLASASADERVRLLVRCVDIAGERYCLHVGFTEEDTTAPEFWQELTAPDAAAGASTGGLSLADELDGMAALSASARADAEAAEVAEAEEAVGTVKMLSYYSRGQEPPDSLFASYPEWRLLVGAARSDGGEARMAAADGNEDVKYKIMNDSDARRQVQSNWCGPATMQMIDGGDPKDSDGFNSQQHWATKLGTASGTAIVELKRQINASTSWDGRAGKYAVVGVKGWDGDRFWRAVTRQVGYFGAPWVQHPKLIMKHHHYLQADHGGHFQPGRGYERASGKRYALILEPYNEPDWTGYTQKTSGPRRIGLLDALQANKANTSFKNIAI